MDFSIRPAVKEDYAGLNVLFEELDEHHRKALPRIFRKPDGPARMQDFLLGVLADPDAAIFIAESRAGSSAWYMPISGPSRSFQSGFRAGRARSISSL
jgi:hypothetical protein